MNKDYTKYEKFERLAQKRVSDALNKIRLIGNLSDRRNYSYTEEQIKEMFEALDLELKNAKQRYRAEVVESQVNFSFKSKLTN